MIHPITARWDISTKCNLCCIHCCAEGNGNTDMLDLESALYLVDLLKLNGIKNLNILGKEPFLYPHINDVLEYACHQGFNVDITTNGTIIDDCEVRPMVEMGLRSIFFSFDGSSSEVNDTIRGTGVFEKALGTLKKFVSVKHSLNSNLKINVNTVLNKINQHNIIKIIELCNTYGVDGYRLSHLNLVGKASTEAERLFLEPAEEIGVAEKVMEVIPNYPSIQFNILSSKPKMLEYFYQKFKIIFPVGISGCKACINEIYIDSLGNIAPCLSTYEGFYNSHGCKTSYKINILKSPDAIISRYPFYKEFKNNFPLTRDTYKNYIPCNSCPYLTTFCYPCPLGKPGESYKEEYCAIVNNKLCQMGVG